MLSIPILSRLLGSNGPSRKSQEQTEQQVRVAAFRIDPAMRYYLLSDFHLELDAAEENPALLKLLTRLLTEGGIGGVFLLGDLAARPGIRYRQLVDAHPKTFDAIWRLTMAVPVFLVQGECDLQLDPPEYLRVVERFEDDRWILLHGHQFDPAVKLKHGAAGELLEVERGEPAVESVLAGVRELRKTSGKQVVFGHVHRAGYVEPGLVNLGHWIGGAADYAILRQGQVYLSSNRSGY